MQDRFQQYSMDAQAARLYVSTCNDGWLHVLVLTWLQQVASPTGDDLARAGSNSLLLGQTNAVPAAVMGFMLPHVAA